MDPLASTLFRRAAVTSGLVTQHEIDCALVAATELPDGTTISLKEVDDERLAEKLIELGHLNQWQVEQLKEGRTKFTLGPYRILDSLGRGGMGHVFKGEHAMLGRVEAVKVLPKDKSTPEAIESFQREIRAQAQLDHPNLVRLSYAGQDGDTYFFVTECVDGTDLRRLVRKHGRLTMPQAATIISQAAQALGYVHQRGLIHRDVKPGNLLVTNEGRTKVTDLGLSMLMEEESADRDGPRVVGTVDYLAPELIRDASSAGPASDIYSLGCTLYYAVTAKVPFPGGNTTQKLRRHLEEPPLNPRSLNPDLSDMFLELVAAMMDKNPATRIGSTEEVVKRLRPWTLASVSFGEPTADGPTEDPAAEGEPTASSSMLSEGSHVTGFEDTAANLDPFLAGANEGEGLSQSSQGTLRVSAWLEDTTPIAHRHRRRTSKRRRKPRERSMNPWVAATVFLAVVITVGVIGLIIFQTVR